AAGRRRAPASAPRARARRRRSIDDQLAAHAAHVDLQLETVDRRAADVPVEPEPREPARCEAGADQRTELVHGVDLHPGDRLPARAERGDVALEAVEYEADLARESVGRGVAVRDDAVGEGRALEPFGEARDD